MNQTIDLHDKIVSELFDKHSCCSLIWLINQGRELEFTYLGINGFISMSHSSQYVSLWLGKEEQAFESVEQLLEYAVINHKTLLEVWDSIELGFLF